MTIPIFFFSEEIDFNLENESLVAQWINNVIKTESHTVENINYIFCSDNYLHQINLEHLNHDTFTDIITFDLSEEEGVVSSDIFISIDRVKENADSNSTDFSEELHRVLIHGVLHLIGYDDKTAEKKEAMRKKEDACLSLRQF